MIRTLLEGWSLMVWPAGADEWCRDLILAARPSVRGGYEAVGLDVPRGMTVAAARGDELARYVEIVVARAATIADLDAAVEAAVAAFAAVQAAERSER